MANNGTACAICHTSRVASLNKRVDRRLWFKIGGRRIVQAAVVRQDSH
jgi:hypothetical protein